MADFYDSWVLEFEFQKLMTLQDTEAAARADSDGDKDDDTVKAVAALTFGFIYSSTPNETFYEISLAEHEKKLVDLTKLKENDDEDQLPFIRINYEQSADEQLEAIVTNDEVMQWFEDFKNGKVRQVERLSNSSGVGML